MHVNPPGDAWVKIGLLLFLASLLMGVHAFADDDDDPYLRAKCVITVSDDFVVDVYQNGKKVSDLSRSMLHETFGAETEQDNIQVRKGDWLVFNVVNFPFRWHTYFLMDKNQFGFVSSLSSGEWSSCSDLSDASRFISEKDYMSDQDAEKIPEDSIWADGIPLMKTYAGDSWKGTPLWGKAGVHSVWIKVQIN